LNHQILSVGQNKQNQLKELYLKNSIGTLVLEVGALVLFYENELALNESVYWQKGKFYIQRRTPFFDDFIDEEKVLEKLDWIELQARVGRFLGVINQKQFLAKIEEVKNERKKIFSYRDKQNDNKSVFQYNGKVLSKESFIELQEAIYTPSTFISNKPVASLECAQKLPCFECVENCPEGAIEKNSIVNYPKLNVEKCTGCGACVAACPAQAAVMVQELSKEQKAIYFLPERYKKCDSKNSNFYLLNRKGEKLGQGKFIQQTYFKNKPNSIVEIEGSHIYAWDARNYKQEKIIIYDEDSLSQKINHKVGWIAINGVKRLVQLEVPLTIVLNRIGLKRFEDSKFCFDFSCRLCKVKVNGKIELACRLIVKEGMQIEIELNNDKKNNEQNSTDTYLCYCKKITKKTIEDAQKDGASIESICHNLGYGEGTCLGRYCLSSVSSVLEKNFETDSLKIRPYFFGFDKTPWFELWNNDVLITKKEIKRN
jgi:Fe-S-cluster-containing hydrogenase component 2/bacterioferritin-associated ferredoxin